MPDNLLIWSVVIPVKVLASAKSRLAGLAQSDRAALALAMAADTVAAAVACPGVGAVIVVTDDQVAAGECARLGALVIADEPGGGLNPALVHGASRAQARWPGSGRAGLAADVPAVQPAGLAAALAAAAQSAEAFVPDAAKLGTTMYAARPGTRFRPRFGPLSRARHAAAGAAEIDLPGLAGLRRDVDTIADLRDAAALGLGARSAALAAKLLAS
jgi:2-phospho-L-lactate guanylyltransferase